MKAEFGRIVDDNSLVRNMVNAFKDGIKDKILRLARKRNPSHPVLKNIEDAVDADGSQSGILI